MNNKKKASIKMNYFTMPKQSLLIFITIMWTISKDQISEEEARALEVIRKNDLRGIRDIIRNGNIPARNITETVIKECKYSKGVMCLLREISKLLKTSIPHATGTWCGYKPGEPYTPVFVVNLSGQTRIPEQTMFRDYEIVFRHEQVPNDEDTMASEIVRRQTTAKVDEMLRVHSWIRTHTKRLMQAHSNLSIIKVSPVKACGYEQNDLNLIPQVCIVFYVPVKGIIPVSENAFDTEINGIPTDVREGEFVYFGKHDAHHMQRKLRMGCIISADNGQKGTLGGFVDLPDNKVGFITCAHVVLAEETIHNFCKKGHGLKKFNNRLKHRETNIPVYQPKKEHAIGRVYQVGLGRADEEDSSVDAAVIEITNGDRKPDSGEFPTGDFESIGFPRDEPMMFNSGEIVENIKSFDKGSLVIKYGSSTGITRGCLDWPQLHARTVNMTNNLPFPILYNQLLVKSADDGVPFAEAGDSGALVFLCVGGNLNNLRAIGMVVGGSTNLDSGRAYIVTPIKAIFEQLGFEKTGFKRFPDSKHAQQQGTTGAQNTDSKQTEEIESIKATQNTFEERLNKQDNTVLELRTLVDARTNEMKTELKEMKTEMKTELKEMKTDLKEMKTDIIDSMRDTMIAFFKKEENSK